MRRHASIWEHSHLTTGQCLQHMHTHTHTHPEETQISKPSFKIVSKLRRRWKSTFTHVSSVQLQRSRSSLRDLLRLGCDRQSCERKDGEVIRGLNIVCERGRLRRVRESKGRMSIWAVTRGVLLAEDSRSNFGAHRCRTKWKTINSVQQASAIRLEKFLVGFVVQFIVGED